MAATSSHYTYVQEEMERTEKSMEEYEKKIKKVEEEIEAVDGKIEEVDQAIGTAVEQEDVRQLRDEKIQLREEKKERKAYLSQLMVVLQKKEELRTVLMKQKLSLFEEEPPAKQQKLDPSAKACHNLRIMKHVIGAPSSFAHLHKWPLAQKRLEKDGCPLKCHRPAEMYGPDITLFYRGFDEFVQQCRSVQLEEEDTTFVTRLSIELSMYYENEACRNKAIREILGAYLLNHPMISAEDMDGAVPVPWGYGLILETRNEVGTGGCDSFLESVAHYTNQLQGAEFMAPCFLVEVVGVHICIYGAVFLGTVCVDRLTNCLWLAFQPNNRPAMLELGRTLKALKMALQKLNAYYEERGPSPNQKMTPCFRTYYDAQEECDIEVEYVDEIKNQVYRCETNTKNVVVKFAEQYGKDAHDACSTAGYAPALLYCKKVTSRFYMVVMEEIKNAVELTYYILSCTLEEKRVVIEQCKKALTALHSKGFCHGDFRTNNILVSVANGIQIWVIDFDWSGKIGEATYPMFMNHTDIEWHPGASDGKPMAAEHDVYWLNKLL